MSVSGIKTNEEVNAVYKQLRVDRKVKAIILKINDKTELEVETQFPTEGFQYSDFEAKFPQDDGRFAVIDFEYEHEDGRKDFKIIFILWCPIQCKPIKKMKYSTSVNGIVDGLGSIALSIQADGLSDVSYDKIKEKLLDKFK